VATFESELLDVRTDGLGDPHTVKRQEADERVLLRSAESRRQRANS
jgi:hypothetical protein